MQNVRTVLTFRASSIGDALMGKYFLENVHEAYPHARYAIVVAGRAAMLHDLFMAYPWLEILEVNRHRPLAVLKLIGAWHGSLVLTQYAGKPGGKFSLASKLVARLIARNGGMVGFTDASSLTPRLYDHLIDFSRAVAPAELERQALDALHIPVALATPSLRYVAKGDALAHTGVTRGSYIVVHFYAGNPKRGIAPEQQRAIVEALHAQFPDKTLLVSGGEADRSIAESIAAGIENVHVIAGAKSLQEMMELIDNAAAVVSADTGMAHITAQLGRPLVVMRTCLGPQWWLPEQYGAHTPIRVLSSDESCASGHSFDHYPACINSIAPHTIVETLQGLLAETLSERTKDVG